MIQLHDLEHLQKFTGHTQYADSSENPHENSVNKVGFTAIDQAIKTFMGDLQDVRHYNTEATQPHWEEIEDQLNTLHEKSTKLSHEFVLNYYLSQDDGMYGINVKIEFFILPPYHNHGFFKKMAVLHIDGLHCHEYFLG